VILTIGESRLPPWLIVASDFRLGGGMDWANFELAWHLGDRLGREVHLVAHRVTEPLASHSRVRVYRVKRPLGWNFLGDLLLNPAGRRLARRLSRTVPEIRVLVNGGNCLWPGANWVHMVHHACRCVDGGTPWWFRLKNLLNHQRNRWSERVALARSPLVIANSEKTRREVIDYLKATPERVHTCYLGTDPLRFRLVAPEERSVARRNLGLPVGQPTILFVGALGYDRNKGFDTLLRAWRSRKDKDQAGLLVALGGGRLDYWRQQCQDIGLTTAVRLVGTTDRVADYMAAADVLVSPTRYDAYGLAVHEALCRGLPAIVSTAAGVAERYPPELRDLLLPNPEDAQDLAERLGRCLDRLDDFRQRTATFSENLRARTWEHMADAIVRLVEENRA